MSYEIFPYTNFHEMNLDWFLSEFEKIQNLVSNELTEELKKLIDERFNQLMIDATYEEETETLILKIKERKRRNGRRN